MNECKNCRSEIKDGHMTECPNCGATFCTDCAEKTYKICPYCYSNLEYIG
ncbi:MAG: hypothetical protein SPL13_01090 [Clostridia bacterium]|nr:hypothetical protein [Clostridia bacterium]